MIQHRLLPYPFLETYFLRQSGNGSAPKTEAGAYAAADFNTAANWTTAWVANDDKIGPGDRVVVLNYDGMVTTQLVVQASGLDASRPITIQGRGFATLDEPVDLNGKVFIVIEDLIYPGHLMLEDGSGDIILEDGTGAIRLE